MANIGFEKRAFASFIALVLFGALLFGGVKAVSQLTNLNSKASINTTPQSIELVNVTDTTATIFWQTQDATTGFLAYGDTVNLGKTRLDDRDRDSGEPQPYRNHLATLTNLSPKTKYYYKLGANDQTYDRGGSPYIFFTSAQVAGFHPSQPLTARVLNTDRTPAQGYFVTLVFEEQNSGKLSNILGAVTANNGQYTVDLTNLRTADGINTYALSPTNIYTVDIVILDEFGKTYTQSVAYSPKNTFPTVYFGKTSLFDGPAGSVSPLLGPVGSPSPPINPTPTNPSNQLLFGNTTFPNRPTPRTTGSKTPVQTPAPHKPSSKSLKLLL